MKIDRRQGCTCVELLVALCFALFVTGAGFQLLAMAVGAERRNSSSTQAMHQACLSLSWLRLDLENVHHDASTSPVTIDGGAATASLRFHRTRGSDGLVLVTYSFDPGTGTLTRRVPGDPVQRFDLGPGSKVAFELVVFGAHKVGLSYTLTTISGHDRHRKVLCLAGSCGFKAQVSAVHFPFWNRTVRGD